MSTKVKKLTSLSLVAAFLAIVMSLSMTSLAFAQDRQVQLNPSLEATSQTTGYTQTGGTLNQQSITVGDDNLAPVLPVPTAPDGWTFLGWYTQKVTTMWWNDNYGGTYDPFNADNSPKLPEPFTNLKNLRSQDGSWNPNNCYWSYLVGSNGTKVEQGTEIPAEVETLYAAYVPNQVTVTFWYNGYNGTTAALKATRDYGTSTSTLEPSKWEGHTFVGWFTDPAPETGQNITGDSIIKSDMDLFAHWTPMESWTGKQDYSDAYSVKIVPDSITLDPKGTQEVTAHAFIETDNSGIKSNPKNITWVLTAGDNLVEIVSTNADFCTLRSKNTNIEGTAKLTVKVQRKDGSYLTDTKDIKLSHIYDGKIYVTKYPNCTEPGYGYTICRTCGNQKQINWPADGHRFTYNRTSATCTEPACEDRYCVVCQKHEHEVTAPALGHHYVTRNITSCLGKTTISTCSTCGNSTTTEDPNGGQHSWKSYQEVDKEATCATEGSKSTHCTNCEMTKDSVTIPVTDNHQWSEWEETIAPTLEAQGQKTRHCTLCQKTEIETLEKLTNPENPDVPAGGTDEPELRPIKRFDDVSEADWCFDAVNWAYQHNIFSGYNGTNLFGPYDKLTRAQAAQVLKNWFAPDVEVPTYNTTPFSDISPDGWYVEAINWAYQQGIFTGYSNTTLFGVNDDLTREQMCTIMMRAVEKFKGTIPTYSDSNYTNKPDYREVSDWATESVKWATSVGVINGVNEVTGHYLRPHNSTDRAQMAQIMMNAITNSVL